MILTKFNKQQFLYICLTGLLFFFCAEKLFFFSSGLAERVASYITYPIMLAHNKVTSSFKSFSGNKETVQSLTIKLDALQKEKEDLSAENIQLKSSLGHLEQVSELIEFKKRYNINSLITAQIIMKQISDQGHSCFIDKGSSSGITKDMVAVYKNALLGRVMEVYPHYSKVVLITDKSSKVAAFCFKTGATGIYEGSNLLDSAQLEYVNHFDSLQKGDLIFSSGEGLIYPQGFALGKIERFLGDGIQYQVDVKPAIDIDMIKYCYLISK